MNHFYFFTRKNDKRKNTITLNVVSVNDRCPDSWNMFSVVLQLVKKEKKIKEGKETKEKGKEKEKERKKERRRKRKSKGRVKEGKGKGEERERKRKKRPCHTRTIFDAKNYRFLYRFAIVRDPVYVPFSGKRPPTRHFPCAESDTYSWARNYDDKQWNEETKNTFPFPFPCSCEFFGQGVKPMFGKTIRGNKNDNVWKKHLKGLGVFTQIPNNRGCAG